jgi:hypothetical protein
MLGQVFSTQKSYVEGYAIFWFPARAPCPNHWTAWSTLRLCRGLAAWFGVDHSPPSSADINLWSCTSTYVMCLWSFLIKYSTLPWGQIWAHKHFTFPAVMLNQRNSSFVVTVNWRSEVMSVHQLSLYHSDKMNKHQFLFLTSIFFVLNRRPYIWQEVVKVFLNTLCHKLHTCWAGSKWLWFGEPHEERPILGKAATYLSVTCMTKHMYI